MSTQQFVKCYIVALLIQLGQVMVGHCTQIVHYSCSVLIRSSFVSIGNDVLNISYVCAIV